MNISPSLKPALYGAVAGAIALAVVGFGWGGWVTGGKAARMASDQARVEVVAALVPICIEKSKRDPQVAETLAALKEASSYKRSDILMKAGWATMPGSSDPDRQLASACIEQLSAEF